MNPPMCKRCKVTIDASHRHCPVCGSFVHEVTSIDLEKNYPTPDYQALKKGNRNLLQLLFAFPLLLTLFVTLMIDLALFATNLGSTLLVTAIVFYAWVVIYRMMLTTSAIGYRLLWHAFGTVISFTMITMVGNQWPNPWTFEYVVPIVLATTNVLFFIMAAIQRRTDVFLFQMLIAALLGLAQWIVAVLVLSVQVPSLISGITSLISIVALLTFLRQKFFAYIQRWLHL